MSKRIVYSTDGGRLCVDCGRPVDECRCKSQTAAAASDGIVRLQRQIKGRNGKPVVVISGVPLDPKELKSLARSLKAKCGVGGSVNESTIIIQGDKRELLKSELEARGYRVKISGG